MSYDFVSTPKQRLILTWNHDIMVRSLKDSHISNRYFKLGIGALKSNTDEYISHIIFILVLPVEIIVHCYGEQKCRFPISPLNSGITEIQLISRPMAEQPQEYCVTSRMVMIFWLYVEDYSHIRGEISYGSVRCSARFWHKLENWNLILQTRTNSIGPIKTLVAWFDRNWQNTTGKYSWPF